MIWLLTIAVAVHMVLALAFWFALIGRTNSRTLYLILTLLVWLGVSGGFSALLAASIAFRSRGSTAVYFPQAATLAGAISLGGLVLLIFGALGSGDALRAARWKILWLLAACLIATGFAKLIQTQLDHRALAFKDQTRSRVDKDYAAIIGPAPSDADNAADFYERAFAEMKTVTTNFDKEQASAASTRPAPLPNDDQIAGTGILKSDDLLSKENVDKPETAQLLSQLEPAIDLLHQAAARKRCWFPTDAQVPDLYDTQIGKKHHLNEFRLAARVLRTHAIKMAQDGKPDIAIHDVQSLFRVSCHIDQSRAWLVCGLVRIGIQALAVDTLVTVLPYTGATTVIPDDLVPPESELTAAFDRDLLGEQAYILGALLHLAEGKTGEGRQAVNSENFGMAYRILWFKGDVDTTRNYMDRERSALATHQLLNRDVKPEPGGSLMVQILLPALRRASQESVHNVAAARQARTAISLTRYRIANGRYPESLEALVPQYVDALSADPVDGLPMRYRVKENGVVIYSVGANRVDDGGEIDDPRKDWGFRLELKEKSK